MNVTRLVRIGYALLAWAFLAGLTVQVFLIGLFIFYRDGSAADTHVGLGWMLHLMPLLILPFAYFARAGRANWLWALGLTGVVFVVPLFVIMRDSPTLAALHPVSAMVSFGLALIVALNSARALRATASPPTADQASEA